MTDDPQQHIALHNPWGEPWFDQPIVWSRRKRFVAWLKRKPLPTLTPREAQRLINAHMVEHIRCKDSDRA